MSHFARVVDHKVVEVFEAPTGSRIGDFFHQSVADQFAAAPAGVQPGWRAEDGQFLPPPATPPTVSHLIAYAADTRWRIETGGITVDGVAVATDDRSKLMLAGARIKAQADPSFVTTWFGADGTATQLNAGQIVAISDAVLDHVDRAFARFAVILAGINSGAIASPQEVSTAFAADVWPEPSA